MPGRNEREAYNNYADPLQRVLGCITREQLFCNGGYHSPDQPSIFTFYHNPVQLSDSEYSLHLAQHFRFVKMEDRKEWKVKTHKYTYAIERHRDKHEVIAFHWDSTESASVHYAHIHAELPSIPKKCHVPTGRVPIEDVVWFAIHELGVAPINKKWKQVIMEARSAFMKHKTW